MEELEVYVYEYDSGGYFVFRGENCKHVVKHRTSKLHDAYKYEDLEYAEPPDGNCGPGKFVKIIVKYTLTSD